MIEKDENSEPTGSNKFDQWRGRSLFNRIMSDEVRRPNRFGTLKCELDHLLKVAVKEEELKKRSEKKNEGFDFEKIRKAVRRQKNLKNKENDQNFNNIY